MSARAETLTHFLRNPNRVLRQVAKEDVVLVRTGGRPAIRVSLASRAADAGSTSEMATHLLADALDAAPDMQARMAKILARRLAWIRLLPPESQAAFALEFTETLAACVSIGNSARLSEVVGDWKATASIYADPDLVAELGRPLPGTTHRVPRPKSRAEKR